MKDLSLNDLFHISKFITIPLVQNLSLILYNKFYFNGRGNEKIYENILTNNISQILYIKGFHHEYKTMAIKNAFEEKTNNLNIINLKDIICNFLINEQGYNNISENDYLVYLFSLLIKDLLYHLPKYISNDDYNSIETIIKSF